MLKWSATLMQLRLMRILRFKDRNSSIPRQPTFRIAHRYHRLMTMEENLIQHQPKVIATMRTSTFILDKMPSNLRKQQIIRHSLCINKVLWDQSNSINRSLNNQRTWAQIWWIKIVIHWAKPSRTKRYVRLFSSHPIWARQLWTSSKPSIWGSINLAQLLQSKRERRWLWTWCRLITSSYLTMKSCIAMKGTELPFQV